MGIIVLYVAAYFSMVERVLPPVSRAKLGKTFSVRPDYSYRTMPFFIDYPGREWFFAPIHEVDRIIRPHVWNYTFPSGVKVDTSE